jgi:SAM-dependent methyltransferase
MSAEMIRLARKDYDRDFTVGFARWDITSMPLEKDAAVGIVILGLFHRLPQEVRLRAIEEMSRVSRRWAIVSFTEDNPFHRVKRRILRLVYPGYKGAPCPWSLAELISEIEAGGFNLASQYMTIPWLSSEIVCLFERRNLVC